MSTAAALDFTYQYAFPSAVGPYDRGFGLQLATCGPNHDHPRFLDARLRHPRTTADMPRVPGTFFRTTTEPPRSPLLIHPEKAGQIPNHEKRYQVPSVLPYDHTSSSPDPQWPTPSSPATKAQSDSKASQAAAESTPE